MKDEDQARADSSEMADDSQGVESNTEQNMDGNDSDGEISKEEQALLDSITDPAAFMNAADSVGPNPEPAQEEAAEGTEEETSEEESQEESGEEESEEETEDESTEEGEEETEEESESEETDETEDSDKPKRYRLRSKDPMEQRFYELARNPDLTFDERVAKVHQEFGIKDDSQKAEESESEGDATPEGPQTVAEVDAEIDRLQEIANKAWEEDLTKDVETEKKITDLMRQRSDLAVQEALGKDKRSQEYNFKLMESEQKAVELYPFTTDPNSEGVQRMNEIMAGLKASDDERLDDPNLPLLMAKQVAQELGILPTGAKRVSKSKPKPGDGIPPKKKTVQPARATARTATPKKQSEQLDDIIDGVKNPHDFEALVGSV